MIGGEILRIREIRKERGMTQKELAQMVGVDQSAVAQWETGTSGPHRNKLSKLAQALECTVDDLLKEEYGGENNGKFEN
jgi:transcriptional regulator with XRE-family HTH domain